jgi:DnaJ family protein C protein 3
MNNAKKAESYCTKALTYNPTSLSALLNKAQRQLDADDFEPAIATLNTAKEHRGNTQTLKDLLPESACIT